MPSTSNTSEAEFFSAPPITSFSSILPRDRGRNWSRLQVIAAAWNFSHHPKTNVFTKCFVSRVCSYSNYSSFLNKNCRRKLYLVSLDSYSLCEFENGTLIAVRPCSLYFENLLALRRHRFKGVICFGTLQLSLGRGEWNFDLPKKQQKWTIFSSFWAKFSHFLYFTWFFSDFDWNSVQFLTDFKFVSNFSPNFKLWVY